MIDHKLIDPWPSRIIYFYGSDWQSGPFDYLQSKHKVNFVKGFDDSMIEDLDTSKPSLIICDDLILEMKDSEAASNLFMRGSHHKNMSVILIEQSLFPKGKQSVSMKINTHYLVIFKSPADALGVATIAKQMFPQNRGRFLIDAYHDCTREPFSYIIIDSKQETPDDVRIISQITGEASYPLVYVRNHRHARNDILKFNNKQQQQQSTTTTTTDNSSNGRKRKGEGTIFS